MGIKMNQISNFKDVCEYPKFPDSEKLNPALIYIRKLVDGAAKECDIWLLDGEQAPEYFERYLTNCIYGAVAVSESWIRKDLPEYLYKQIEKIIKNLLKEE